MHAHVEATMRLVPCVRSTMGFLCELCVLCGKNFWPPYSSNSPLIGPPLMIGVRK